MVIVHLGISGMQLIKNHPIRCYDVDLVLIARVSKYGHAKAKVCQDSEAEKKMNMVDINGSGKNEYKKVSKQSKMLTNVVQN